MNERIGLRFYRPELAVQLSSCQLGASFDTFFFACTHMLLEGEEAP